MATDEEQLNADRQDELTNWNENSINLNLKWMNDLYDKADSQNKALADTEKVQNRRKAEADRFQAQRSLQNAARGLSNSIGSGMNGSALGNMVNMINGQQDADNVDYWTTLNQNDNTVDNAYQESLNQNYLNRYEAGINAEIKKRDLEAENSSNRNNISQDLWQSPSDNAADGRMTDSGYTQGSYTTAATAINAATDAKGAADNRQRVSGYHSTGTAPSQSGQANNNLNDYFSRMLRSV